MQNPCQDSYYTLFSSYTMLLDYHEEQAKNSRWIRCKVADLQVEPLGESSPLIGNLSAFAAGTSQEAVKDTAENLGLAMRVNGELYPVRMTAYKKPARQSEDRRHCAPQTQPRGIGRSAQRMPEAVFGGCALADPG